MQNPSLTLKIEMFGNLVDELNHWNLCCEDESVQGGDELEYCEQRFLEVLDAVKEYRELLLEEFEVYFHDCKLNKIPIDISYYRIKRQLQESYFELGGI